MDVKQLVGRMGLVAVMTLAAGAGAEPAKGAPAEAAKTSEEQLPLKPGEVHQLKLANVSRIAVADPEIADVRVTGADIVQVKGLKKGETAMLVWMHNGKARKAYKIVVGG